MVGWLARLARSGFVHSPDTELVNSVLSQILNATLAFVASELGSLGPFAAVFVLLFDDVRRDGRAAVRFRRRPFEVDVLAIPVLGFWFSRSFR